MIIAITDNMLVVIRIMMDRNSGHSCCSFSLNAVWKRGYFIMELAIMAMITIVFMTMIVVTMVMMILTMNIIVT